MIIYKKLGTLLAERKLSWKDLRKAGLSQNMPNRLQNGEKVNIDTINRVCEYVEVQPGEIMEWIPDIEYEEHIKKQELKEQEKIEIQRQIETLQKKLDNLQ